MTFQEQLQQKIDLKTKPLGALGQLEKLAWKIGTIQQSLSPSLDDPTLLVFAGDHGIARSGVSAYPPEVTHQMVLNFLTGGAAINVFARQHGIALKVIDAGVNFDFEDHPDLINQKIAHGTANFLEQKAMSVAQLEQCLEYGHQVVRNQVSSACNVIGFGEMGIGNTSAASMMMSSFLGIPIEACVGKGTGVDEAGLQRKIDILQQAQHYHAPSSDAKTVLQTFGGFEMAQMVGAMLEAYAQNMILLIDGFIATAAFLAAQRIQADLIKNAVFCHLSDEQAHGRLLQAFDAQPLLNLNMRLGEGTGCALAYPLLQSAVAFLNEMASFSEAGVSNKS